MGEREKLTAAQRAVLSRISERPNSLREDDEVTPPWWIEADLSVRSCTARALRRKGLIKFTQRLGGVPGILCYSITPAGRAALAEGE